ncbi:T9SS type A sorting domain-containing protein [bacterium]|nr:T9SS type A sorting domain-containing protein [bacterium]
MFRNPLPVRALLIGLSILWSGAAHAAIVHHTVNYTGTVAGGPVVFDLADGSVTPGLPGGPLEMALIPSNGGANMQIQFASGSGGGVVITISSPSLLAEKFPAGVLINDLIPEDTSSLPGYSTVGDVGAGKIRYFGSGNFGNGERGFVGFRLQGGAYYGWAEVSAIDSTSFTVYQFAYENTGAAIAVGSTTAHWVGMWDGTLEDIPAQEGWSVAGLHDRLPYGTDIGEEPLGIGGSLTHTHSVNPPSTQTQNDSNDQAKRNLVVGLQVADTPHKHTVNFPTVDSEPGSTLPALVQKLALLGGDPSSIPEGLIGLWSGAVADIPSGWSVCDGVSSHFDMADRFLMATANGEQPQALPDAPHVHEVIISAAWTTSSGPTNTVNRRGALLHQAAHPDHTHNFIPIPYDTDPIAIVPPYTELAFLIHTGPLAAAPPGLILMWSGSMASLPADWVPCDGTNGTPDLRNRFIRGTTGAEEPGATGGSTTHNHTVDPPPTSSSYASNSVAQGAGASNVSGAFHVHTVDVPQFSSGSGSSIPPYVKLAFVMYQPSTVDVAEGLAAAAGRGSLALHPAVPNPFGSATSIRFETTRGSSVDLAIYDATGRRVRSLVSSTMDAGSHTLRWDGRNDAGTSVATGIYFVRLRAEGSQITRKMTMLR